MSKPRKLGRRTRYTPALAARVTLAISDGLPLGLACVKSGISESAFHAWRHRYADFGEAVEQAKLRSVEVHLATIREASKVDWRASLAYLQILAPEHFSRQRVEVSHQHAHAHLTFSIPPGVLDEISRARRAYEQRSIDVQTDPQTT